MVCSYTHPNAVPFEVLAKISGPYGVRFERLVVNAHAKRQVTAYALDDIQRVPGESVKIMAVQPKRQLDMWRAAHGESEITVERMEWLNKMAAEVSDREVSLLISMLRTRVQETALPKDSRKKAYDRKRKLRVRLAKAAAKASSGSTATSNAGAATP